MKGLLFILLMILAAACATQAQTMSQTVTLETVALEGAAIVKLSLEGFTTVVAYQGSQVRIEKRITIKGVCNNADNVLAKLLYDGTFDNTSVSSVADTKEIKILKPTKTFTVNGQQIEVTQSFKVFVPETITIIQ